MRAALRMEAGKLPLLAFHPVGRFFHIVGGGGVICNGTRLSGACDRLPPYPHTSEIINYVKKSHNLLKG